MWKSCGKARPRAIPPVAVSFWVDPVTVLSLSQDRVTASTGVPVAVLNVPRRGWILAEHKPRGKRKFRNGAGTSHRRCTAFPQECNSKKTQGFHPFDPHGWWIPGSDMKSDKVRPQSREPLNDF